MVSDTDPLEDNHYPIVEIFDSIQGEGSWLGIPSTFIRFGGCNLRCSWCDTKKSWENAPHLSIADIIQKIHYDFIILTGGEPTLYHLDPLLLEIKKKNPNVRIAIETNGTRKVTAHIDWITVSPKPDANYKIIPKPNELKYVVVQNFQVAVIPEQYYHNIPIWLQPNGYDLQASMKTAFELVMKYPFLRLGVQAHKMYNVA